MAEENSINNLNNLGNLNKEEQKELFSLASAEKSNFLVIEKEKKFDMIDALRIVAPGTKLREALDEVRKSRKGALIVVDSENLQNIIDGGFKINCKFTPQKLFELSKMDGAIILSSDLKKILQANSLLVPSSQINSEETGTRHKAAERTAKQARTLVIAISERKNTIKVYYNYFSYLLKDTEEILGRAIDKLQILDKQREIYNNLLSNLNKLEITGLVSKSDVSSILQRIEIILNIADVIKKNIIELGNEGDLIKIRLKELTKGIDKDKKLIMKDYIINPIKRMKDISKLNFDSLLDTDRISEILFSDIESEYIRARGFRLLEKIDFNDDEIKILINKHENLNKILESSNEELEKIIKNKDKTEKFLKEISVLRENILMEKGI